MRRLNRNVSENSLRLYLKKLKNLCVENLQNSSQHENFTTTLSKREDCTLSSTSSTTNTPIHPSATATIVPNEFTYYLYNNFASTTSTTGLIQNGSNIISSSGNNDLNNGHIAAASMIYVNSDHGNFFI